MAIKCVGFDNNPFDQNSIEARGDRFLRCYVALQFSGNYVSGGDTLDLTNGGGSSLTPNTIPPAAYRGVADIDLIERSTLATSLVGAGGFYQIVAPNANMPLKFADLANLKLKVFKNTAGSVAEYPAGAYGADVLADIITLEVVYAR